MTNLTAWVVWSGLMFCLLLGLLPVLIESDSRILKKVWLGVTIVWALPVVFRVYISVMLQ